VYKETSTDPILYELNVPHAAGADGFGGSSYIDSWALRERDQNLDGTLETRTYYIQNWRADVISELTDALSSWTWAGDIRYSAYGEHEFLTLGDVSNDGTTAIRDGGITSDDFNRYYAWYTPAGDSLADVDDGTTSGVHDGGVTIDDLLFYLDVYNEGGLTPDNPRFLYAGYVHDPVIGEASTSVPSGTGSGLYHVRNRVHNPELGRWTRRDPLGYVDGPSTLSYSMASPQKTDPMGLYCFIATNCHTVTRLGIPLGRHCGLVIISTIGTYRLDGSGGDTNIINIVPGKASDTTDRYKSYSDAACLCLLGSASEWNANRYPRDHLRRNSNWTLKCALKRCGIPNPFKQGTEPTGYESNYDVRITRCVTVRVPVEPMEPSLGYEEVTVPTELECKECPDDDWKRCR